MSTVTKTLYETDFVEWADHTAELLRQGKFAELDVEHLVEEVEGLAGSERRAVKAQLLRMMKHLVKQQIQPERRGSSWIVSIDNAQHTIEFQVEDSPSLRRYAGENLEKVYRLAVREALRETGVKSQEKALGIPEKCRWTIDQLLEADPETLRWE
jgi:hypothetical protein